MSAEDGHVPRRDEWLAAHHRRWSSPHSLLRRIVREAGLAPDRFERLLAGQANEVYAVASASDAFILRITRRPDPRFETEAAVIERVRLAGVPVPQVVAIGSLDEAGGQTAFILERRVSGRMLRDVILEDPVAAGPALEQLGEVLAGVHEVPVDGFGNVSADLRAAHRSCSGWIVDTFVERHLPKTLAAVAGDGAMTSTILRAKEALFAHRDTLDQAVGHLAHGDVSPTNVLVDNGRIAALVDWEGAKGAPQANDFAWWASGTVSLATPPSADILLAGYQRVRTLDDHFWTHFMLCQLRILMGLIGYAVDARDLTLLARASARLRDSVDAVDT